MAERIRRSNGVPQSPQQLFDLLASEDVVRARGAADGMGTRLLSHEVSGSGVDRVIRIVTATDIPLDWLPGAVRSRLGETPRVERTETWALEPHAAEKGGEARTPLEFSFSGLPVSGSGTSRLTPDGAGSRFDTDLSVRVDVPLIGALIERSMAPRLGTALDAEAKFYSSLPPAGTFAS